MIVTTAEQLRAAAHVVKTNDEIGSAAPVQLSQDGSDLLVTQGDSYTLIDTTGDILEDV